MESSKATAKHTKQVATGTQAAQINLMRHQHTELSSGKHKKKHPFVKSRQPSHKNVGNEIQQVSSHYKKSFDPKNMHKNKDRCSKCGDSTHVEGFQYPVKKFQCKACHKFGHFTTLCFQKKQVPFMSSRPKAYQLQAEAAWECHMQPVWRDYQWCLILLATQSMAYTSQCQEVSHTILFDYKSCILVETSSYKKSIS